MADSLYTISLIANDGTFAQRLYAGTAKEEVSNPPELWVNQNRWAIASAPTWAEKVDYWIASNPGADPVNGWAIDPAVISDDDIIAQIQFLVSPPE